MGGLSIGVNRTFPPKQRRNEGPSREFAAVVVGLPRTIEHGPGQVRIHFGDGFYTELVQRRRVLPEHTCEGWGIYSIRMKKTTVVMLVNRPTLRQITRSEPGQSPEDYPKNPFINTVCGVIKATKWGVQAVIPYQAPTGEQGRPRPGNLGATSAQRYSIRGKKWQRWAHQSAASPSTVQSQGGRGELFMFLNCSRENKTGIVPC